MNETLARVVDPPEEPDYSWPFGAKHKRSRRIIGLAILLVLILPVIWFGFGPEITAIRWHWKYGDTFAYEGVLLQIPKDHYVQCWTGQACNVIYAVGYFRWRTSKPPFHGINLNYATGVGQEKLRTMDRMRAKQFHWIQLGERRISLAGSEMICTEYTTERSRNLRRIPCYGSGTSIVASYFGADDPEKFYTLLSTAQKQ